jgi:hypothetical protein
MRVWPWRPSGPGGADQGVDPSLNLRRCVDHKTDSLEFLLFFSHIMMISAISVSDKRFSD